MIRKINERKKREMRSRLAADALKQLGKPYKYGAWWQEAPKIFDCSTLTQWLYKQIGIEIPRVSIDQAAVGRRVPPRLGSLKTGDLIFLRGRQGRYNVRFPSGIGHVVIVTGPEEYVHASSKKIRGRAGVRKGKLSDLLKSKDITAVKRIL